MGDFADGARLGSTHTNDICYICDGKPILHALACGTSNPSEQQKAAKMLREYWTSFAKSGQPTSMDGPTWRPVQEGLSGLPLMHFQLDGKSAMSSSAWFTNASAKM